MLEERGERRWKKFKTFEKAREKANEFLEREKPIQENEGEKEIYIGRIGDPEQSRKVDLEGGNFENTLREPQRFFEIQKGSRKSRQPFRNSKFKSAIIGCQC